MIHLDTNYLILGKSPGTKHAQNLAKWLRAGVGIDTSAMAWAEFMCGPVTPAEVVAAESFVDSIVPMTREDADLAAELYNRAGRRRGSLADCLIAAVAIRAGAELATENTADFTPLVPAGLRIAV